MADDKKSNDNPEAIELADSWVNAVITGDMESDRKLAARIRDEHELRPAIIAAIRRRKEALDQSFSTLVSSIPDHDTKPCSETETSAAMPQNAAAAVTTVQSSYVSAEIEYKKLLKTLRNNVKENKAEHLLARLKKRILGFQIEKSTEEKERDIQRVEKEGKRFLDKNNEFLTILRNEPISDDALAAYKAAPHWYKYKAEENLTYTLTKKMDRLSGDDGKLNNFVSQAIKRYAFAETALLAKLDQIKNSGSLPEVDSDTEHRLNFLKYNPSWTAYIDETGTHFNPDDAKGKKAGKVVAVLVPDNVELPPISSDFHATENTPNAVLSTLNELLCFPVGLLGFSAQSLNKMSEDEWFQNIRELINWIWRLLPLSDNVNDTVCLNVVVENRENDNDNDTPNLNFESMVRAINQDWDKENPERKIRINLETLRFAPKGESGGLAWADVAAYVWGSTTEEIKNGLKQSGLPGTCYFDVKPDLMNYWIKGWIGRELLDGEEWQCLLERKDANSKGSLTWLALEPSRQRCLKSPDLARRYIDKLRKYLDDKKYDLKILDRQLDWLSDVNAENIALDLRFYWESAKLAKHNHSGDFSSEEARATRNMLQELLPGMDGVDSRAAIQARLRMTVMSFNAYDFSGALDGLAVYDPEKGGRLPENDVLSAGKILSSLGQAWAFLGDAGKALALFDEANKTFERLTYLPLEKARQQEQTGIYAAIAAMDDPTTLKDEKCKRVEYALDLTILEASRRFSCRSGVPINELRYRHHLLTRYLVSFGSEREKNEYLARSSKWLNLGEGLDSGHPWYLIQYYRWLMLSEAKPDDTELRDKILESIFDVCLQGAPGLTIELIELALAVATGWWDKDTADDDIQDSLSRFKDAMPLADRWLKALAEMPANSGPEALAKVLPFNYR